MKFALKYMYLLLLEIRNTRSYQSFWKWHFFLVNFKRIFKLKIIWYVGFCYIELYWQIQDLDRGHTMITPIVFFVVPPPPPQMSMYTLINVWFYFSVH